MSQTSHGQHIPGTSYENDISDVNPGCMGIGLCMQCNKDVSENLEPKYPFVSSIQIDTSVDTQDNVNHPSHYGGEDNPYEVIKVIEAWGLDFHLGTVIKYIPRAGKKDPKKELEDLEKALWYLQRKINLLKEA